MWGSGKGIRMLIVNGVRSALGRERAAALFPVLRGLASTDRPQVGRFTDAPVVLGFLARGKHPALAALGILALPYLFRAVFFLERVLEAQL